MVPRIPDRAITDHRSQGTIYFTQDTSDFMYLCEKNFKDINQTIGSYSFADFGRQMKITYNVPSSSKIPLGRTSAPRLSQSVDNVRKKRKASPMLLLLALWRYWFRFFFSRIVSLGSIKMRGKVYVQLPRVRFKALKGKMHEQWPVLTLSSFVFDFDPLIKSISKRIVKRYISGVPTDINHDWSRLIDNH